jgi:MFS family permease
MLKKQEAPGAWLIVGVLFVSWFFVWGGGANTGAVFFTPVLKHFGWSRARLSFGYAAAALSAGATGPIVGWLLDRIDARKVMVGGVAILASGYILLTRTHTFPQFFICNLAMGVGFVASTAIPCSVVIANWFTDRRGLAMGITLAGASIGGAVMTPIANYAIAARGWEFGYLVIAVPMAVITIPLLIAFVRTRPPAADPEGSERFTAHYSPEPQRPASEPAPTPTAPIELPGLELGEALRTRSMWLITIVQFLFASLFAGLGQHFIAYLIDIGYSADVSARVVSLAFVFTTIGSLLSGPMADRVNARQATAVTWVVTGIAVFALLGATHFSALMVYAVLVGVVGGAFGVLLPLLMLESLGIRRFGSLMGLAGVFSTLGYAAGPVITGRIHDLTGSYTIALWLFIGVSIFCALACLACRPLESVSREGTTRAAA